MASTQTQSTTRGARGRKRAESDAATGRAGRGRATAEATGAAGARAAKTAAKAGAKSTAKAGAKTAGEAMAKRKVAKKKAARAGTGTGGGAAASARARRKQMVASSAAEPTIAAEVLTSPGKAEAGGVPEPTFSGKHFVPATDIYETGDALYVVMDLPGVGAEGLEVKLDGQVLHVQGRIDLGKYQELRPVYVEYEVGHFERRFTLSSRVDAGRISASLRDGVLTVELPKVAEARRRKIPVR